MFFLSIDLGTESARAGVYSLDGQCLGGSSATYATTFPRPGWAEQDPLQWWESALTAAGKAIVEAGVTEVAGIAVSTTASSVVFLDRDGIPIRPALLWMDTRSHAEATSTSRVSHPNMAYSGGVDSPEWLVPKAMWVKRNEEELFARSDKIGEAVDFLTLKLTGRFVGSDLNATCKWNYDPRAGALPRDLYSLFGIEELADKLPQEILPVGTPVGTILPEVASRLGLRNTPVVSVGGIDAHMALIALRGFSRSAISIAAGTSNAFIAETDTACDSPEIWGPYPDALTPGRWLVEGGQLSAGSALTWVAEKMLGYDRSALPALVSEVSAMRPGSSGLIVLDDFMGNRTPFRDASMRGGILGLSLGTSGADIYQATVEAVAFGTKQVLDSFERAGIDVGDLYFSGGIGHNPLWMRTTASVIGQPIHSITSDNLTLIATAATAAVGAGAFQNFDDAQVAFRPESTVVEPDLEAHQLLSEIFLSFTAAKESNRNLFAATPLGVTG
jgi:FGGY-family pentulose kinase